MLLEEHKSSSLQLGSAPNGTNNFTATATYQLLDPAYAQFRDQSRFWIQRVAVPLLMVIGLFGNSITVIIMTRRRMRSTTNMYLAALAFVDMLYLVLTFLLGLSHYPNMAANKYYAYWKLRPFLMMLTDACSNTSVWLTVTFTIERYIAVKYPMRGKVWCTEARAKMLIVFVFAFGILFASPVPFEWTVIEKRITPTTVTNHYQQTLQPDAALTKQIPDQNTSSAQASSLDFSNNGNSSSSNSSDSGDASDGQSMGRRIPNDVDYTLALDYSEFGRNETYKTIYYWSTAVIFYFIPLFSLMLFNGFLIKSVHHSRRVRRKMTRTSAVSPKQSLAPTMVDYDKAPESDQLSVPQDHAHDMNVSNNEGYKKRILSTSSQHKTNLPFENSLTPENSCQNCSTTTRNDNDTNKQSALHVPNEHPNASSPTQARMDHQRISFIDDRLTVSQQTLDSKITPSHSIMSNVHNDCDNGTNIKQTNNEKEADNVHHQAISQSERSFHDQQENSFKDHKGLIHSNGFLGNRLAPLRRSQITNASSRSHQSIAPASTQERRITIMLIAVVILFLVCQIPSAAMILYTSVNEPEPNTNEHALVLAFGNIFNFLMAVNAAGNFILYSFLSKKYRRTFMILFCGCLGSRVKSMQARPVFSSRYDTSGQSMRSHNASLYQSSLGEKVKNDTPV